MTNQQALNLLNLLNGIVEEVEQEQEARLPAKVSYAIQKNINRLAEAYKDFQEEYKKIAEEYGEVEDGELLTDEEDNIVFKDETSESLFREEFEELRVQDSGVDCYEFPVSYLDEIPLEFTVAEVSVLDPVLSEG